MPKLTQIYHDPFARYTLYRQLIKKGYRSKCTNCNNDARFKYYIQNDGLSTRLNPIHGKYCSITCMREYTYDY